MSTPNGILSDLLGTRTTVRHVKTGAKRTSTSRYKGYTIYREGEGFSVPELDPDSLLDSKRDAQRFIEQWIRKNGKRRNPGSDELAAAAQLSEAWHGRAPHTVRELETILVTRDDFADLGGLEELVVCDGSDRYTLRFGHDVRVGGVLNEERTAAIQLYFVGGDQEIDLSDFSIGDPHDKEALGSVASIVYATKKDHLDNVEAPYEHEFGEEGGECPLLVYDVLNQRLELVGGSYFIKLEDYDGKHSRGIRN